MSMSTSVIGIRASNAEHKAKRDAVIACVKAKVNIPKELLNYFGDIGEGTIVEDAAAGLEVEIPKNEWRNDYASGYEIEVSKIPPGVEKIRFYNSW